VSLVYSDRLKLLLGRYAVGDASCLVDPGLVAVAQDYRRRAQARMQPVDPADLARRLPPLGDSYHVSLKIDGEFNILVYQDGEAILVNPGGTVRAGLAQVDSFADAIRDSGMRAAVLAGELYFARPDSGRCRVHDVTRVARNPQSSEEVAGLRFAAFDVIALNDALDPARLNYAVGDLHETWEFLSALPTPPVVWCKTADEIRTQFDHWIAAGAEGIVIRSDPAGTFKVKPRHAIDAVVIGFTEDPDQPGRMHDLLVALMRPDGCFQVLGRGGGGFTDQDRRDWCCDLKDAIVESDYLETNDGVAYQMVRPKHVIEISCLDVIAQSTRGQPIMAACLLGGEQSGKYGWHCACRLPLAALISPQFVRRRDDKGVNVLDLRLSQVADLVEVPLADRDARQVARPASELLRRGVWTKTMKGQTVVRKLLMWQTNKHEPLIAGSLPDFPAYVIACTDYSPGRAEPLQRDIRASNSRAQIDELYDGLLKEKVVKGWRAAERAPSIHLRRVNNAPRNPSGPIPG
jgi:hypothetical protein